MKRRLFFWMVIVHCYAAGIVGDTLSIDSTMSPDSVQDISGRQDSPVLPEEGSDSLTAASSDPLTDTVVPDQQVPAVKPETTRKIKLIKRTYDYRQQVRLAVVMMVFVALAMMSSQTWNPK